MPSSLPVWLAPSTNGCSIIVSCFLDICSPDGASCLAGFPRGEQALAHSQALPLAPPFQAGGSVQQAPPPYPAPRLGIDTDPKHGFCSWAPSLLSESRDPQTEGSYSITTLSSSAPSGPAAPVLERGKRGTVHVSVLGTLSRGRGQKKSHPRFLVRCCPATRRRNHLPSLRKQGFALLIWCLLW